MRLVARAFELAQEQMRQRSGRCHKRPSVLHHFFIAFRQHKGCHPSKGAGQTQKRPPSTQWQKAGAWERIFLKRAERESLAPATSCGDGAMPQKLKAEFQGHFLHRTVIWLFRG